MVEVGETDTDDAKAENSCAKDDFDGTGREGNLGGRADESTLSLNPDFAAEFEVVDTAEGGGELLSSLVKLFITASPVVYARGRWNSSEPARRLCGGEGGDAGEPDLDRDVKSADVGPSDAARGAVAASCPSRRGGCFFGSSSSPCRCGIRCSTGSAVIGPSVNDAVTAGVGTFAAIWFAPEVVVSLGFGVLGL